MTVRVPWLLLGVGGALVLAALLSIAFWTRTAYVALGLGAACLVGALALGLVTR